jgi:hypothetical protein
LKYPIKLQPDQQERKMPNIKINVKISGKWVLDGRAAMKLLRSAAWTGLGAGGIWLLASGLTPSAPDMRTPPIPGICQPTPVGIPMSCMPRGSAQN